MIVSILLSAGAYVQDFFSQKRHGNWPALNDVLTGLCGTFWVFLLPAYMLCGNISLRKDTDQT